MGEELGTLGSPTAIGLALLLAVVEILVLGGYPGPLYSLARDAVAGIIG